MPLPLLLLPCLLYKGQCTLRTYTLQIAYLSTRSFAPPLDKFSCLFDTDGIKKNGVSMKLTTSLMSLFEKIPRYAVEMDGTGCGLSL